MAVVAVGVVGVGARVAGVAVLGAVARVAAAGDGTQRVSVSICTFVLEKASVFVLVY